MTTHNLNDFFREKRAHAGPNGIDWEKRRQEWIEAIEELYETITNQWLATPIQNGSVEVDYRPKTITEDFLGTYDVREMILRVGEEMAVFSPKGRNIVGTSGRIDLKGEMGEITLVMQPGPRWSLVAQRSPSVRLAPLEESTLLAALKDVMRP